MDLNFSAAELTFRNEVRQFLTDSLPDHLKRGMAASPSVFVEPDIGQEWQAILNAKGWLGYQWPVDVGGTGWTPTQTYIFEKECALAGAPGLTVLSLKLLAPVVWAFGTQAQKSRLLPRVLSGEDYYCQGFSEPGSGSDLASLQTRGELQGDHYIVNGSKIWTTHAHHANKIFALVRTQAGQKKQQGISFLLLDMDQPGITVRPITTLGGDHEVNQVFFDNAVARLDDRIGEDGDGWKIAKFLLENERGGSCHAPKLLADLAALEATAAQEPDGTGGLLADTPGWKRRIARIKLEAQALEIIELRILADIGKGRKPGPQTSLIKLLSSNLRQAVDMAWMDVYGDAGLQLETARPLYGNSAPAPLFSREAQIAAPRYLNSRAWTIFGGTNEVQVGIIAKTVLGL
jgi:alkylation response protein AidB-like acyl-CoA dehydrogenase